MTLDMLEILVDAAVRILETAAEAEYYGGLLFIVCALGIGSVWVLATLTTDYSFGFLRNLFS